MLLLFFPLYFDRNECKEQVDKYQYASYKKFATEKEAWAFINEESAESSVSSTGILCNFINLNSRNIEIAF